MAKPKKSDTHRSKPAAKPVAKPPPAAEGAVVRAVVDGLAYTKRLGAFVGEFLRSKGHLPAAKRISADMRVTLPEASRYVVLAAVLQLSDFAAEAAQAFHESRNILLPRPQNDVDHTVMRIWKHFNDATLQAFTELEDMKEPQWNPYESLHAALETIATHVGEKHFGLVPERDQEPPSPPRQKRPKVRAH
jgi:hypothetical protein